MGKKMEKAFIGGHVLEVKQVERNGIPVGIVKGYIATWDVDRGAFGIKDKFIKGAFAKSIKEHKKEGRQIRLKDHHGRTIGGFPIDTVKEDDIGLYGEGEINLEVQQGKEAHSLALQGVLTDFSVGWSPVQSEMKGNIREITEAIVWEGSIVDEPMNPKARIVEVKSVVPFQDLPLADRDRPWDSTAALDRVREFTDSVDSPSENYKNAFIWYDRENQDNFGAYKLPIADIVDGRLTAIPRGVFVAAAAMSGARGGVDIPDEDRERVISHINRYYDKMDMTSPFREEDSFRVDDLCSIDVRTLEKLFKSGVCFSNKTAKALVSAIESAGLRDAESKGERDADWQAIDSKLDEVLTKILKEKQNV